ncbi:hypothetical protein [Streptomyces chartreusis]
MIDKAEVLMGLGLVEDVERAVTPSWQVTARPWYPRAAHRVGQLPH